MTTLLEQAKSYVPKRKSRVPFSPERLEVALAWFRGEITPTQCAFGLGLVEKDDDIGYTNYARYAAMIIKIAMETGLIKIVEV